MNQENERVAQLSHTLAKEDRDLRTINMMRAALIKGEQLDPDTASLARLERRALKAQRRKGKVSVR
jgi:hypothetical protein